MNACVTRVSAELSRRDFDRHHYLAQKPVLIMDGAARWGAVSAWSPDYLKERVGQQPVTVSFCERGIYDINDQTTEGAVQRLSMPFAQAVDLIRSEAGHRHYIQQEEMSTQFNELLVDVKRPYLLNRRKFVLATNLWFGGTGCKTPLHYDQADNFLVQVFGRKRVLLFAPEHSEQLYPALGARCGNISQMDIFRPDLLRFPQFALAEAALCEVSLEPGSMLYIPSKWWHAVETLETSASINYWWMKLSAVAWARTRHFVRERLPAWARQL